MDGRALRVFIYTLKTSSIILPLRGRMMEEVFKVSSLKSYPNHSDSVLVPSVVVLVVILPPSGLLLPSPPTLRVETLKAFRASRVRRVFGRFRQNGQNTPKRV